MLSFLNLDLFYFLVVWISYKLKGDWLRLLCCVFIECLAAVLLRGVSALSIVINYTIKPPFSIKIIITHRYHKLTKYTSFVS
jgi:hypothetical protein